MITGYLVIAIEMIFYQFKGNNSSTAIDSLAKLDACYLVKEMHIQYKFHEIQSSGY